MPDSRNAVGVQAALERLPECASVAIATDDGFTAGVVTGKKPRSAGSCRISWALKAAFSGALMYWILRGVPLQEVGETMRRANVVLLLAAMGSHCLGYWLSVARWRILLRAQGADPALPHLVAVFLSAMFFNNLLPSTIGGDAFRMYESWRLLGSKTGAVAVIFADRALGLLALLLMGLGAMAAFGQQLGDAGPLLFIALIVATVCVGGMLILVVMPAGPPGTYSEARGTLPTRWRDFGVSGHAVNRWANRLWRPISRRLAAILGGAASALGVFRGSRGGIARAFVLSVVLQVNVVFCHCLIAGSLHLAAPAYAFFLVVPLASLITMLPISINGIGLREHAAVALLGLFGVARPEALAFAWLAFGLLVVQGLAGGMLFVLRRSPLPRSEV